MLKTINIFIKKSPVPFIRSNIYVEKNGININSNANGHAKHDKVADEHKESIIMK